MSWGKETYTLESRADSISQPHLVSILTRHPKPCSRSQRLTQNCAKAFERRSSSWHGLVVRHMEEDPRRLVAKYRICAQTGTVKVFLQCRPRISVDTCLYRKRHRLMCFTSLASKQTWPGTRYHSRTQCHLRDIGDCTSVPYLTSLFHHKTI